MRAKARTREQILKERRQLREKYGELYDSTAALLFRHDPIGISFENSADEYEAEAGTILPRLRGCRSVDDVRRVVHEEFVRWFEVGNAGPEEQYSAIASDLWQLWQRFHTGWQCVDSRVLAVAQPPVAFPAPRD